MSTAADIAETFALMAEMNYRRDGHLVPVVSLIGHQRVYCTLGPTDDVPDTAARVVAAFAAATRPDFVAVISETWKREVPPDESLEHYQPGDLERAEQAGDPSVFTALMVMVLDTKSYDDSYTVLSVDRGDRVERDLGLPGRGEGRFPELLIAGYELGMATEPPTFDVEALAEIVGRFGWITSIMVEQ